MSTNGTPSVLSSPTSEPSSDDLSSDEIQALEADHGISLSARDGKRAVSVVLLGLTHTSSSSTRTLGVPEYLNSVATLEIIGLESPTANAIFSNWARRGKNPDGLTDYVRGHIGRLNTPAFEQYTPDEAMIRLGITPKVRKAITDPRFADMFGTETLQYWLNDTLRNNYFAHDRFLSHLKEEARKSAARLAERASPQGVLTPAESSSDSSSWDTQ